MKKLFLYNLFPPFIMNIIYSIILKNVENPGFMADLSWWLILSQCFIVLPSYYIGTFMLFYFKYKKDIKDVLKAEFVSVVILPVMLMVTSGIISKVSYSLQDLVVYEMFCILSFSIAFLFGAIIIAVSMLRASGVIDIITRLASPLISKIGMPPEVLPLALMRPLSGSGALAVITDIFKNHGTDSFIGKCASVMMGSTETTFYTIAVYFGSVGITRTRHTLVSALTADAAGMICAVLCVILLGV